MPITDTLRLRAEWGGDGTAAGLGQIETKLRGVGTAGVQAAQGTTQAAQSMSRLDNVPFRLGGIVQTVIGGYLGIQGVRALVRFAGEVEAAGDTAQAAGAVLASQLGSGQADAIDRIRKATFGTRSELEMLTGTARGMNLLTQRGFAAGKAFEFIEKTARFASLSAQSFGRDYEATFDAIISGVARAQPRYLEAVGLIIDEQRLFTESMTESEKATNLMNAAQERMAATFAATSAEIAKTYDWTDRLRTHWSDFAKTVSDIWSFEIFGAGPSAISAWLRELPAEQLREYSRREVAGGKTPGEDVFYQEILRRGRTLIAETEAARLKGLADEQAANELAKVTAQKAAEAWVKATQEGEKFASLYRDVMVSQMEYLRQVPLLPVVLHSPASPASRGFQD